MHLRTIKLSVKYFWIKRKPKAISRLKDGQVVESEYVSLREGDIIQRNGSHLIILGNSYYFDDLSENDKLLISIKIRILPEGTTIML